MHVFGQGAGVRCAAMGPRYRCVAASHNRQWTIVRSYLLPFDGPAHLHHRPPHQNCPCPCPLQLGAAQDIGCPSLLASAPDFALFSSQDWECAFRYQRLWRWDPAKRAFANDFNFTSITAFDSYGSDTVAHAASDKWAVFANTVEVPVMPTAPGRSFRLEARVWNGAKWAAVQPLGGLTSQYVHAVVSLPSGGAVVGFQSAAGVWRLV